MFPIVPTRRIAAGILDSASFSCVNVDFGGGEREFGIEIPRTVTPTHHEREAEKCDKERQKGRQTEQWGEVREDVVVRGHDGGVPVMRGCCEGDNVKGEWKEKSRNKRDEAWKLSGGERKSMVVNRGGGHADDDYG